MMGVEYVTRWAESSDGMTTLEPETAYDIAGYDRMIRVQCFSKGIARVEFPGDGLACEVTDGCQTIRFTDIPAGAEVARINLKQHVEELLKEHDLSATGRVPNAKMIVSASGNGMKLRLCPWDMLVEQRGGETRILRLNATVLYSKEKPSGR